MWFKNELVLNLLKLMKQMLRPRFKKCQFTFVKFVGWELILKLDQAKWMMNSNFKERAELLDEEDVQCYTVTICITGATVVVPESQK